MSQGAFAAKVIERLRAAGFSRVEKPLAIASIIFEFSAIFLGGVRSNDLVVVVDTSEQEPEGRLIRRVDALVKALDISASRRSLTAVVVGAPLASSTVEFLSSRCRVLFVPLSPETDSAESIDQALAVLLPLDIGASSVIRVDSLSELKQEFRESVFLPALDAAASGVEAVRSELRKALSAPIETRRAAE